MCGITGCWDPRADVDEKTLIALAARMADCLRHRGPDEPGYWADPMAGLVFGFRRLSIQDLTAAGHQPMVSASGRFVLVFNGEIYNSPQLRAELIEHRNNGLFRGHSDTEVILAAVEFWGLVTAVKRLRGMFAFALWDRQSHELHLCRDRIGIKPLFFGRAAQAWVFGSELKSLVQHPAFRQEIDRESLMMFLRHGYVPAPSSIYVGVRKVLPGTIVTISGDDFDTSRTDVFWSLSSVIAQTESRPFRNDDKGAIDALHAVLGEAVEMHLLSDVPLGAFLSGGIDSSTVVALMQERSSQPVHTFAIGFEEDTHNEAPYARAVANRLGTHHTELIMTHADALQVIPDLPNLFDEPFADSSQIPTYLVAKLARRDVTVALSGDGGDELFGGYTRYGEAARLWNRIGAVPTWARSQLSGVFRAAAKTPDTWLRRAAPLLPHRLRTPSPATTLARASKVLTVESGRELYRQLISHWDEPGDVALSQREERPTAFSAEAPTVGNLTAIEKMMYMDTLAYLPDDILVKLDRATMGVGLEARVPLLDHTVVEFAWSLPFEMKVRGGDSKWLLRQLLQRFLSRDLIDRPKMGFAVPVGQWLRGPLRSWAASLLDPARLSKEGFLNPVAIAGEWRTHAAGERNRESRLWGPLMFQAWLANNPRAF